MKKNALILIAITLISFGAFAQDRTPGANARQGVQRARIHEGRKEGEITNREAAGLNMEQRHIRRSKRRAKADGVVTPRERVRLDRKQNRASRHIRRAKHNDIESSSDN
jgi:hypothetical protein